MYETAGNSDIPPIYVSSPSYDDMGAILDRLDIPHSSVNTVDIAGLNDGIILLNCSFQWRKEIDMDALSGFVKRGGTLMASDLTCAAVSHLSNATFQFRSWNHDVDAVIENSELTNLLGQERVELDFDTAVREPDVLPANASPLIRTADGDSVIAYKFPHHKGDVIYTVFHNHSQPSAIEDALLQTLLMIPIAESTDSTVTETYTTFVADGETTEDTQLVDENSGETTDIYQRTTVGTQTGTRITEDTTELELITVQGGNGRFTQSIGSGESITLGRDDFQMSVSESQIQYVSGKHLEIRNNPSNSNELRIRDTDSTNGTALSGSDISDGSFHSLESGAELELAGGRVTFDVQLD